MLDTTTLELACAEAWPPVVRRPLGQWQLRAAAAFTGRANSALALGDPGMPFGRALESVCEFAHSHHIDPLVQAVHDSDIEAALAAAGWVPHVHYAAGHEVSVLLGPLPERASGNCGLRGHGDSWNSADEVALSRWQGVEQQNWPVAGSQSPGDSIAHPSSQTSSESPRTDPGLSLPVLDAPTEAWWQLVAGSAEPTRAQRHVLAAPGTGFGLALLHGTTVGAVRTAAAHGVLHVSRLEIHPEYRRRGLASALLGAAGDWARERDLAACVLQVSVSNRAALALYERLGFTEHHRYRYWAPGSGDAHPWKDSSA